MTLIHYTGKAMVSVFIIDWIPPYSVESIIEFLNNYFHELLCESTSSLNAFAMLQSLNEHV